MRLPQSLCSMLKAIRSEDSAAENTFTGMETRPNEICPVAMARGIETPLSCLFNAETGLVNPERSVPRNLCILECHGMNRYASIWSIVRKIPHGRVATYGQIA